MRAKALWIRTSLVFGLVPLSLAALVLLLNACGGGASTTQPPPSKPTISLSPATLTFTATVGGANAANQTVSISSSGTAPLNFQATAASTPAGWLSVSPISGSVATGSSTTLTVSTNIAGLAAANLSGTISVSDPAASNSPQSVSVNLTVNNPAPAITSLSPSRASAGGQAFTLTVNGTDFVSSSIVRWNNSDRPTTFVTAFQLQASIPASDVASAGTAQVTVFNPAPGGGTSRALTFTIIVPGAPLVAYVANSSSPDNVSLINTANDMVIATVTVGLRPMGVAITPDASHVYVANVTTPFALGPGSVSVIDTTSNTVIATVPVGSFARRVTLTPDGHRAYVTNFNSGNVSVIDTATDTVVATVPVGTNPFGVAITADGSRAYVTNFNSGNVSVIDTATDTVVATVPVGSGAAGVAIQFGR